MLQEEQGVTSHRVSYENPCYFVTAFLFFFIEIWKDTITTLQDLCSFSNEMRLCEWLKKFNSMSLDMTECYNNVTCIFFKWGKGPFERKKITK